MVGNEFLIVFSQEWADVLILVISVLTITIDIIWLIPSEVNLWLFTQKDILIIIIICRSHHHYHHHYIYITILIIIIIINITIIITIVIIIYIWMSLTYTQSSPKTLDTRSWLYEENLLRSLRLQCYQHHRGQDHLDCHQHHYHNWHDPHHLQQQVLWTYSLLILLNSLQ